MNKAAVYVFSDALCMEYGFTLSSRYFKTVDEANEYAKGFQFTLMVEF